jgi:hypothetical protein
MVVRYACGRAGSSVAEQGTFNPLVVGSNPTRLASNPERKGARRVARAGALIRPNVAYRVADPRVAAAATDTPGSCLRIIQELAIANQATHVSWAMYVIQPLAE